MERLTSSVEEAIPAKTRGPGKVQRWIRAALLGTLPFLCGGDTPPTHFGHEKAAQYSSREGIPPKRSNELPGTFSEEQMKHSGLTEEQYIDLLTRSLDTPEKLGQYLQTHIQYAPEPKEEDHWQTPEETIRRGKGDCEDYALLAERILNNQGKNAHVVSNLRDHASCVWIKKRPDGRYDGYNFDDAGMDKNGKAGEWIRRPYWDTSPLSADEGHESVLAALNAAISSHNGKNYSVNPSFIPILHTRNCGLKHRDYLTVDAFDPDGSIVRRISHVDASAIFILLAGSYAAYALRRRRKDGETWKKYSTEFCLY